jgi:hypothetical protein
MSITTVKMPTAVRDKLAQVARADYGGAPLGEAVERLLAEHEEAQLRREVAAGYARLQEDPGEWAAYLAELDEWDAVTADGTEPA